MKILKRKSRSTRKRKSRSTRKRKSRSTRKSRTRKSRKVVVKHQDGTDPAPDITKFFKNFLYIISDSETGLLVYDIFLKLTSKKYPNLCNIIKKPYKKGKISIKPFDPNDILFNEIEEKYLYHGTKSTIEIINSEELKPSISKTGKGIYFGRNFLVSYRYADIYQKSSNIKSSKNPVCSVLIMTKEEGKELKSQNTNDVKEYFLESGEEPETYDLIKNLTAIVFLHKTDVDKFFEVFEAAGEEKVVVSDEAVVPLTFSDVMKNKLETIDIFQYDYNPLSIQNPEFKTIRTQFIEELNKNYLYLSDPEIFRFIYEQIINNKDEDLMDEDLMDYLKNLIKYLTETTCKTTRDINLLFVLALCAKDSEIIDEFNIIIKTNLSFDEVMNIQKHIEDKFKI